MTKFVRFTIRDILWLTVVVALIAGWGLDHWRLSRPVGSVNGRICLDGKPVAGGWILFQGTGQSAGAKIDANTGEFQIAFIPTGEYTVAVENAAVPRKYAAPSQSGLVVEINAGTNQLHFDLRSK